MPGSTRAAWLPEESALQINTGICLSHCPADIPHTQQAHLLPKYKKHDFFFFSSRIPTCGNRGLSVILLCIQSLCPRQRQVHFRFMWAAHLAGGLWPQHMAESNLKCQLLQEACQPLGLAQHVQPAPRAAPGPRRWPKLYGLQSKFFKVPTLNLSSLISKSVF